jgi:putative PIN family toxin of toxin-antitoxin system
MVRAVLDTNVFVSALFWKDAPYRILRKGFRGTFLILISPDILEEISRVLRRRFEFPSEDTNAFLEIIAVNAHIVIPTMKLRIVKKDPSDDKIIECAVVGGGQYIVTGDRHLLDLKKYQKVEIVTPQEFLKKLR